MSTFHTDYGVISTAIVIGDSYVRDGVWEATGTDEYGRTWTEFGTFEHEAVVHLLRLMGSNEPAVTSAGLVPQVWFGEEKLTTEEARAEQLVISGWDGVADRAEAWVKHYGQDKKIAAIKSLRGECPGLGLREALDAVHAAHDKIYGPGEHLEETLTRVFAGGTYATAGDLYPKFAVQPETRADNATEGTVIRTNGVVDTGDSAGYVFEKFYKDSWMTTGDPEEYEDHHVQAAMDRHGFDVIWTPGSGE